MKWNPGLRTSFTLWALSVFLFLCLPAITWIGSELFELRQIFSRRYSRQRALDIRERTEQYMKGNISSVLQLADSPLVQAWMANENNETARAQAFASFANFSRTKENHPEVSAAIDSSLHYYFTNRLQSTLSPENPLNSWFFSSRARKERFALDIHFDPVVNQTRFWINAIVRDPVGGRFLGLVSAGIDISIFLRTMLKIDIKGAFITFFDETGLITGYREVHYINRSSINTILDLPTERQELTQAMESLRKSGKKHVELSLDHRGTRYHATLVYLPSIKWYALVFIDTQEVIQLERFVPVLATVLISIAVLFGTMLTYITFRLIHPIRLVTSVLKRIQAGDREIRVPVTHNDETGDLERICNAMADEMSIYTDQLEELVQKKTDELVQKNHELVDSLTYARIVQSGILPKHSSIAKRLPEHCIIWRPKNIVSSDLYWYKETGESVLIAVIDCAGHNIPGALMSMTVNSILDHIVWYLNDNPAAIISELDFLLSGSLDEEQDTEFSKKGIEIALLMLDTSTRSLSMACAGIPVYLCSGQTVETYLPEIGAIGLPSLERPLQLETHQRTMQAGDRIFISSDGIFSQAGSDGSLFGRPRLLEVLATSLSLPLKEQRNQILLSLDRFRQSLPQDDDITVFGFQIP